MHISHLMLVSSFPVTKADHKHSRKGKICTLCSGSRKQFEPTVLYCRRACCGERIRRNAYYYTDTLRQNHWCYSCHDKMKEFDPIILDEGVALNKKDLIKLRNDALAEEEWVECSLCKSFVHQICGLFDGGINQNSSAFVCPMCVIKNRTEKARTLLVGTRPQVVSDIPHCIMSEAMENGLYRALRKAYEKKAKELNVPVDNIEKANNLYVRVVNNSEKKQIVRDEVRIFV